MTVTGAGLSLDAFSSSMSDAAISARSLVPDAPKLSMPSARLYSRCSRCSQVKPMPPSDWIPVSQTWANGEWPTHAYFAATLLILAAGIGVVLLIVMAMYKPKRVLAVTYTREERSPPSA